MRTTLRLGCAVLLSSAALVWAQPTAQRSALVIGVGQYAPQSRAPSLEGVPYDMDSARRISQAMGIPASQIRFMRDQEATKDNILRALGQMGESSGSGARNFIYFSGHGTRYWSPESQSCVEGLLSHDGQVISNTELAEASRKSTEAADKVITMIDACHSGGLNATTSPGTRSLGSGALTPKFSFKNSESADQCSKPSNMRTRSLLSENLRLGALQENVVLITSSRPDEVSFDEPGKGGIATQAVRDCLLGQAQDSDGSGAVSLGEVQQCAQQLVNRKLQGQKDLSPHHVTVTGNRNLVPVPAWRPPQPPASTSVASAPTTPPLTAAPANTPAAVKPPQTATQTRPPTAPHAAPVAPSLPAAPPAASPAVSPAAPPTAPAPAALAAAPSANKPPAAPAQAATPAAQAMAAEAVASAPVVPPALASLATLKDIEQQRDPRIQVDVRLSKDTLRIGKDALDMRIKSSHSGYLYLVMLGSDRKSFYVLYPNGLDRDNRIEAGSTRTLPRPDWQLQAAGPPGQDHLLVMVTLSPRQLDRLSMAEPSAQNPFTYTLNDLGGRAALINYLVHQHDGQSASRFGARLLTLKEVP